MTQSITTQETPETEKSLAYTNTDSMMTVMIGYAISTAILLLSAYSPILTVPSTNTPVMHGLTHGLMFLAMAVMYCFIAYLIPSRDRFIRSKRAKIGFGLVQCILPLLMLWATVQGYQPNTAVIILGWIVFGIASAFLICSWIDALNCFDEEHLSLASFRSYLIAAGLVAAVLVMLPLASIGSVAVLSIIQIILLVRAPINMNAAISERDEQWFAKHSDYSAHGSYVMIVDGVMIGIIAGFVVARVSKGMLPNVTVGIIFLVIALLYYFFRQKAPALLDLGQSQLIFLPIIVCGFILMGFFDAPVTTFVSLPVFCCSFIFDYMNSSILTMRGNLLLVSPCFCYAKGRVFIILGQAIGWLIGAFLASDLGHGSMPIACFILIALICIYVALSAICTETAPPRDGWHVFNGHPSCISRS